MHQGWTEVRETLKEEFKRDGLSESMRAFILEELIETADRQEQVLQKRNFGMGQGVSWRSNYGRRCNRYSDAEGTG